MSNENTEQNTPLTDENDLDKEASEDGVPNLYQKKTLQKVSEETHVIKAKRKYNPLDEKYVGQESTQETTVLELEYLNSLTPEQSEKFSENKLIFDEEKLNSYWNEIKVNDIIGYNGNMYKVEGKTKAKLSLNKIAPRRYKNDEMKTMFDNTFVDNNLKVSKYDLDYAMNIKFTDILYRDGKPYGLPEEFEYKTKVAVWQDEDGKVYTTQKGYEVKENKEKDISSSSSKE